MKNSLITLITRRTSTILHNPALNPRLLYTSPFSSSSSSSSSPTSNGKLFVAGLSWSVDEKSLKDAFSSFGEVSEVKIIYDKDSGRSRGFGFVHFSKEDDAISAKDAMDGKALLGRPLRISFALERVRGEPVIVPRLSNIRDTFGRHT